MEKNKNNSVDKYINIILGVIFIIAGVIMTIIVSGLEGRDDKFLATFLFGICPLLVGVFLVYKGMKNKRRIEEEEERQLIEAKKRKNEYFESLKGLDKAIALRLGREYYGSLRDDGRVTTYDEQAINNDINSMANTVNVVNTVIHKVETEDAKINVSASNQRLMYCSKCGKEYVPNENKKFCEACGNRY